MVEETFAVLQFSSYILIIHSDAFPVVRHTVLFLQNGKLELAVL